jgi:hypothetical protein
MALPEFSVDLLEDEEFFEVQLSTVSRKHQRQLGAGGLHL